LKAEKQIKFIPTAKQLKFPGIGWNNLMNRNDKEMDLLGQYITYEAYVKIKKSINLVDQTSVILGFIIFTFVINFFLKIKLTWISKWKMYV
jgi:hypothetical protein